jgi:hypothetical protein
MMEELAAPPTLLDRARRARSAGEVLELATTADIDIAGAVARRAREVTMAALGGGHVDVVIFDRGGRRIARAGP